MKAEFELNVDGNGRPCIKFRHYNKDNSLEQNALKIFLDAVKEDGCELKNLGGYADTDGNSWDNYEIQIRQQLKEIESNKKEPIDIYSKEGTKVKYTGEGGYDHHRDHADTYLIVGEIYTIDHTDVSNWHTDVYLKEVPNEAFNSVHFINA